jgi:uncharacterized protein HemX
MHIIDGVVISPLCNFVGLLSTVLVLGIGTGAVIMSTINMQRRSKEFDAQAQRLRESRAQQAHQTLRKRILHHNHLGEPYSKH